MTGGLVVDFTPFEEDFESRVLVRAVEELTWDGPGPSGRFFTAAEVLPSVTPTAEGGPVSIDSLQVESVNDKEVDDFSVSGCAR